MLKPGRGSKESAWSPARDRFAPAPCHGLAVKPLLGEDWVTPRVSKAELASPGSPAGIQSHGLLLLPWPLEKRWWAWLGTWWEESQQRPKGWGGQLHPQGCLQGELALGKAFLFSQHSQASTDCFLKLPRLSAASPQDLQLPSSAFTLGLLLPTSRPIGPGCSPPPGELLALPHLPFPGRSWP